MQWNHLTSVHDVDALIESSFTKPCLIFKHSTRCPVSAIARYRLEGDWTFAPDEIEAYFLDLIRFRDVSNYIAERLEVHHESPQVLVVADGECTYDASHLDITLSELRETVDGGR